MNHNNTIVTSVMVKVYLQCPRQLWLSYKTWYKPVTQAMVYGKKIHEKIPWNEIAGKIGGSEVKSNVVLESERYGLRGVLDALVRVSEEWRPIEYKHQTVIGRPEKIQTTLYAILVEDTLGRPVTKAYIVTPVRIHHVKITGSLREKALRILEETVEVLEKPLPPLPRPSKLCKTCPFKNYCYI